MKAYKALILHRNGN